MIGHFRYTLLGDGSSDRCLRPILDWTLTRVADLLPGGFTAQVSDLRDLPQPPSGLRDRIRQAYRQFPCEVMFVHRDAEAEPLERRLEEIQRAAADADIPPCVPVVPVRMTEAWLLIDEKAIRRAADNPHGTVTLSLPRLQRLEDCHDPKDLLYRSLLIASEKRGRRRDQFRRDLPARIHRVADLIEDFSPLRQLPAFRSFEESTRRVVQSIAESTQYDLIGG